MEDESFDMETDGSVSIPIEWNVPDDLVSRYANNVIVQHTEHEFIISFFEIVPPIIFGGDQDALDQVKKMESVKAECVARIVISASRFPEMVQALQSNLEKYENKQANQK